MSAAIRDSGTVGCAINHSRAEQPLLLASPGSKQDWTAERVPVPPLGEADQERDISGIVERAVVDPVALDRLAIAVTVEVRGEDDRLVRELRVGARHVGEHVGRADVALARA